MHTVQIMISNVEGEVKKGITQSKYQGKTAGAQKSDAAIGQANASGDSSSFVLLR